MAFKRYKLSKRVINDLKKRSGFGIFFYLFFAWFIPFSDGYVHRDPGFSLLFIAGVTLICLFRLIHLHIAKGAIGKAEKLDTTIFFASVIASSLIWGAGFVRIVLVDGEPDTRFLMTICSMGIAAGGVLAYVPHLRLSLIFCFSLLLPVDLVLFTIAPDLPLAVSILLFMVYLSFLAVRGHREYWDALENEHLLDLRSRELERISRHDGLTGLINRRYFDETFKLEWHRAQRNRSPLSVVLLDIDDFKRVNDSFGHQAGDKYLKVISALISKVFQRKNDITARYGGEEFIVLLPERQETARAMAEQLRAVVEKTQLTHQNHTIMSTVSIGVATDIPSRNTCPDSLISKADKALYQSKEGGKNRVTGFL